MNYIDAHVHVWTDDFDKYPLAEGFGVEEMVPPTFFPEDIIGHGKASAEAQGFGSPKASPSL